MTALNSILLSPTDCRALLNASAEQKPCSPKEASAFARQLMGSFRKSGDFTDPEVFVIGLAANFALFPASICRQIVDQVHGMPVKSTFLPSIKEARAALDEALAHRRAIHLRAGWMLDEHARRSGEIEAERLRATPEERKAVVERVMAHVKWQSA